jgi:hypothetical protein
MKKEKKEEPYIGQKIYVPTALYLSHGMNDVEGGIATVCILKTEYNNLMVGVQEHPGTLYNWKYLKEGQEGWKERYGNSIAHPDPDDRPEFNRWD